MLQKELHTPICYRIPLSLGVLSKKNRPGDLTNEPSQTIQVERGKLRIRVPVQNIIFVKSEHVYCRIFFLNDQRVLQRVSLQQLLTTLPAENFLRVHRSYAVNTDHIDHFNSTRVLLGEVAIPIGRKWRPEVLERLRELKK